MRNAKRATVIVAATGLAAVATVTAAFGGLSDDGVHIRATWSNGGSAVLELEDRNVVPTICFIFQNALPDDGDGIESRILTRDGQTEVLYLGAGEQWVDGEASGCEGVRDADYRAIFADPDQYIVEFRVLEEQGTPTTPPVRSEPLQGHDDASHVME